MRGEASFSTKNMSAPLHFDPSHTQSTIHTEGWHHHQNSSSVTAAHSLGFFFFFWRQKTSGIGGKNLQGVGEPHTHISTLVKDDYKTEPHQVLRSIPAGFFSFFFKQLDKCETSGHLLFVGLTGSSRGSHCPSINSNYAPYSGGFCACDPILSQPRPVLLHTHAVLTPAFLPPPPPHRNNRTSLPCCVSPPTLPLLNSFGYSSPTMNELSEICTFKKKKRKEKKSKRQMPEILLLSTFSLIPELKKMLYAGDNCNYDFCNWVK